MAASLIAVTQRATEEGAVPLLPLLSTNSIHLSNSEKEGFMVVVVAEDVRARRLCGVSWSGPQRKDSNP